MGGRTLGRRMAVALLLLACVWVLIRYRAVLLHQGIDGWGRILAIATPVAGAFWFLVVRRAGIVTFLKRPQPPTPEEIAAARNNLYAALSGAWSDEVSEVYEDEPMRVSFTPWLGSAPTADSPSWAGEFESVAGSFSREPRFRRVVLGDAGSGKSVLVAELQRELIEAPARPDDPLPVIVRAAAWRPDRQALLDWLAEQLSSDYGWLPVTHARALVARGVVLPILDGLDEMPPELRGLAIDRINKHHIYRPLVLTSREEEYRRAISDKDPGVKHCGVVAVKPLRLDDVKGYLDPSGHGNWAEVLQGLDAGDPLARALANPLMLYLARVEYEGRSPENLILLGHEPAIERHLLREFVPAVYQDQPRQPGLRQFRCSAQQARRWLGHLAWPAYEAYERNRRQADDAGDPAAPVLAWWQISAAAGPWRRLGVWVRTVALASVIGAMTIWVLEQQGNWRNGFPGTRPPNRRGAPEIAHSAGG